MKKNGFTLAELLICFAIIGILIGVAVRTFKTYDKGIKYKYSNIYYVLDRALFNAMEYWVPEENVTQREPFKSSVTDTTTNSTVTITDTEGTKRLCRALIEYINTTDKTNACKAEPVDDSGNDSLFTANKVQFTAVNGVRIWISKRYPSSGDGVKFYIIYADLNGPQRPNSMNYVPGSAANKWETTDPDIFAFAALENGRVCPLGVPEVDPRYLTTRFVYQNSSGDMIYSEPSRPYAYSKAQAWGYYLPEDKNGNNTPLDDADVINSDEPLTYNGYIKKQISKTSKIYSFLNGQSITDYIKKSPNFKNKSGIFDASLQSQSPFGCQFSSTDGCSVIIDKYTY